MQWKPHDITSLLLFKIIERIYKDSVAYAVEDIALKKLEHVILRPFVLQTSMVRPHLGIVNIFYMLSLH